MPELWVGDFDSVPRGSARRICRRAATRLSAATRTRPTANSPSPSALERGATSLVLAGAFGGERADHAFLHLRWPSGCAEAGMPVHAHQRHAGRPIRCCRARATSTIADGTLFSILGFSRPVRPVRDGREMAARQCRGAVRLVADHFQRSARRPVASRSPSAAPCCSPIPYPGDGFERLNMAPPLLDARRHRADLRRHAAARRRRSFSVAPATASRWSAATARASRRC